MITNVDTELKLDDLDLIKHLKMRESLFLPVIQDVYNNVKDILNNRIQAIFPKYTLHNTAHSFRIIGYMGKLVDDLNKLSEIEIALLICSALLHDIGMGTSEEDIIAIKSDKFEFCEIKFSAMKKLLKGDENLALQEYIRRIHAQLSGRYIRENLKNKLVVPKQSNLDFAEELALICESHTQNYDWIKANINVYEVRGDYDFNPQYIACILRLADILDIDNNRTPYRLYKLISPQGISNEEWKQHFVISNYDKIIFNEKTSQKKIVFHGKVNDASTHRKILNYIEWVKSELVGAISLVTGMQSQYRLVYDTNPEVNIQTEGYTFSDYKMTLQFKAITSLLMGEKIYGSRSLGLRELIQNAIDACKIRKEYENNVYEYGNDVYQPKIRVILDQDRNQAIIQDNGIGMSLEIIKQHFLNIGVSYYKSEDFLLKDTDYKPIGNYGIGFLSCFMLSSQVIVRTRNQKSRIKYTIELEVGNEWTSLTEVEDLNFFGTEVQLKYTDFIQVFEGKPSKIKEFISQHFLINGIELELIDKKEKTTEKIQNTIIDSLDRSKGVIEINLEDYLTDIEGCVLIKQRKPFIRSINDIRFSGELYRYDEDNGIVPLEEDSFDIDLDDYINEEQFSVLEIPLVDATQEDDFKKGLQFLYDIDEVINKMESDLQWISVLIPKNQIDNLEEGEIDWYTTILENFKGEDLIRLGHSQDCKTKSSLRHISLFEGEKNGLYMPFEKGNNRRYFFLFNHEYPKRKLFIRDVLIKDFQFEIPFSASVFEITSIIVNIKSRDFVPDISRNNLDIQTRDLLNKTIGKAIHKAANVLLDLKSDEKQALTSFTNTYY